jgi:hypothetical protein
MSNIITSKIMMMKKTMMLEMIKLVSIYLSDVG